MRGHGHEGATTVLKNLLILGLGTRRKTHNTGWRRERRSLVRGRDLELSHWRNASKTGISRVIDQVREKGGGEPTVELKGRAAEEGDDNRIGSELGEEWF